MYITNPYNVFNKNKIKLDEHVLQKCFQKLFSNGLLII